jgi:hypothetical protein
MAAREAHLQQNRYVLSGRLRNLWFSTANFPWLEDPDLITSPTIVLEERPGFLKAGFVGKKVAAHTESAERILAQMDAAGIQVEVVYSVPFRPLSRQGLRLPRCCDHNCAFRGAFGSGQMRTSPLTLPCAVCRSAPELLVGCVFFFFFFRWKFGTGHGVCKASK